MREIQMTFYVLLSNTEAIVLREFPFGNIFRSRNSICLLSHFWKRNKNSDEIISDRDSRVHC